jgi:PAS domain S-box-containing protein
MPDKSSEDRKKANPFKQAIKILNSVSDGIYALDRNWCFTFINQQESDSLGLKSSELIGQNLWAMFPYLLGTPLEVNFREAMSKGHPQEFETFDFPTNCWYRARVYPSKEGITVLWQDITQRKQFEVALKESEEKYNRLLSNITEGVALCEIIFDSKSEPVDILFLKLNDACQEVMGLSPRQAEGKRDSEFGPIDMVLLEKYGQVALTGKTLSFEYYGEKTKRWYENRVYSPQKGYIIALFHDITARKKAEEALKVSESRFRSIFDNSKLGIVLGDMEGRVVSSNSAIEQMLGYEKVELHNKLFTEFTHPDDIGLEMSLINEFTAGKRDHYEIEKRYIRKDGQIIWIKLHGSFIHGSQGDKLGLALIEDITARKKAEDALKISEERFRISLQNSPVNVSSQDLELRYTWQYNPQLGYSITEVIGKADFDLLPANTARKVIALKKQVIRTRKRVREEVSVIYNNQTLYYDFTVEPLCDQQGDITGVMNVVIDITERKQGEEALQAAKDLAELDRVRFEVLLKTSPSGIVVIENPDGRISFINERARELYGMDPRGLKMESHSKVGLLKLDGRPYLPEEMPASRSLLNGEIVHGEDLILARPDGTKLTVSASSSPIKNNNGDITGAIGIFDDITERKKAEESLVRYKDELEIRVEERTEQLQDAYDDILQSQKSLKEANKQLKQYANRITQVQEEERKRIAFELHDDTAQYLSILKMQINALTQSDRIHDPDVLEKLRYLEKDADRAFNDVRRYSHELRPSVLEHMGLRASLEQMAEDINKLNYLNVEVDVKGKEPKLSEEVKLGCFRIAQEAVNNIRKHSKAKKAVINLNFSKKHLTMNVVDDGDGFDVKEAGTKAATKGSLGLTSMRERADLIGASIKIQSKPGHGTIVRVDMPLHV